MPTPPPNEPAALRSLVALDIETDTAGPTVAGTQAGLNPHLSAVLSAALWDHDQGTGIEFSGPEHQLLAALETHLGGLSGCVLVTWNGANFDLPYLACRFERWKMPTSLVLTPATDREPKYAPLRGNNPGGYRARWGDLPHADIMFAYRERAAAWGVPWALKPVAQAAGVEMLTVDRTRISELSSQELSAYVLSDVRGTAALAARLPAHELESWVDREPL